MKSGAHFIWSAMIITAFLGVDGRPVFGEEPAPKIPVAIKADKLDYDRANDRYVGSGNVKVDQEGMHVEADTVTMNNKTGEAIAEGHVYFRDKGDVIRAEKLQINMNTKAGIIYRGDLFMNKDNFHLKGDKIERPSESVFRVENGTFTTCNEGEWYLSADEINVDLERYATGTGVSFNMGGVPVFYTPYLLFPVGRQTGLLIPEAGYSSTEGFLMKNALFWALSDSQDMTLYSDYRAKHGHGMGAEYRYVNSQDSSGKLFYNYFDTFHSGDARWEAKFQHQEEYAEDLSARVDINLVSDHAYYRDLEKKLELRSVPYVDSNAFYIERWKTAALYLTGQYSTDLTQVNEKTIQKLPEVRSIIFEESIAGPVHLNFDGAAANFDVQKGDAVRRADFNPRLTATISGSGLSFTPRVGVRATFYSRSVDSVEPTERKYYYAGADVNARLSREFGSDRESGLGRIRHSIEPTISYSFIPKIRQTGIPQLDSTDLASAQNLIAFSVINRLTAHYRDAAGFRTYDMMVFRIAEEYDVNEAKKNDSIPTYPRSAIRAELFFKTPEMLTVSARGDYNTYTESLISSSEGVILHTHEAQFELVHQFLRIPRTQFVIGGVGFGLGKWDLNARLWRDVENRKTTQEEYRAHFASQCWGLNLQYVSKPGEVQYWAILELKGLGGLKL